MSEFEPNETECVVIRLHFNKFHHQMTRQPFQSENTVLWGLDVFILDAFLAPVRSTTFQLWGRVWKLKYARQHQATVALTAQEWLQNNCAPSKNHNQTEYNFTMNTLLFHFESFITTIIAQTLLFPDFNFPLRFLFRFFVSTLLPILMVSISEEKQKWNRKWEFFVWIR